jgi:hypothetical protein
MLITKGWATEFARQKFSIGVDETDLVSLLVEAGLSPSGVELTEDMKFALLNLEADRFSLGAAIQAGMEGAEGDPRREAATDRLKQFSARRQQIFQRLREMFPGAVHPPEAPRLDEPAESQGPAGPAAGD